MSSAVIYDCEGPKLNGEEKAFFRSSDPWGFILFARHCESPDQMLRLCSDLRDSVGRDAPVLIDQEGGRVARMRNSQYQGWHDHPPMAVFGDLWRLDPQRAREAAWLNGYCLAKMICSCGVTINCAPMLDVPQIDSDPVTVGDRCVAHHPEIIASLGRALMHGLLEGGVLPVIKHMPGLGRALCDSHKELPSVDANHATLSATDFAPFKALNDAPIGMTGHVLYNALDDQSCATLSQTVINTYIRREIGFDGLLLSDDLKMQALTVPFGQRAVKALEAGCDIGLACNFTLEEKQKIAEHVPTLSGKAKQRADAALAFKPSLLADAGYAKPGDDVVLTHETLVNWLKPVCA